MRRIFLGISLFAAGLLAVHPVAAHPRSSSAPYSVVVVDEDERELRTFHHAGDTFVLGEYGSRYNIRVENRTGLRVEAVITVDGRDVVSGKVGDFVNERGYLIEPYGHVVVEGFRQSHSQVAAFRFTSPGNSYSSRMGTPQNVGVIGVAFFPERVHLPRRPVPVPYSHRRYDDDALDNSYGRSKSQRRPAPRTAPRAAEERAAAGSAQAESDAPAAARSRRSRSYDREYAQEPSTQNLGTEYGESRDSYVTETAFRRENHYSPAQVVTLRYDDREGLLARGVRLWTPRRVVQSHPQAFPNNRFAPPPPY